MASSFLFDREWIICYTVYDIIFIGRIAMETSVKRKKLRYADTDIMRIIAAFAVVLFHSASYFQYTGQSDSIFVQAVNIICRFPVPVFFMISGRYMLDGNRSIAYIIKKSVQTLLIIWVVSAIYTIIDVINGAVVFKSIGEAAGYIIAGPEHLWYLYAIICLYLATPMLAVFAQHSSRRSFLFTIVVCILLGSIMYVPSKMTGFDTIKEIIEKCKIGFTSGFTGCYLLGCYLYKYPMRARGRFVMYMLGIAGLAFTVIAYYLFPFEGDGDKEMMLSFLSLNILLFSIAVFIFIKSVTRSIPPHNRTLGITGIIAKCTYGIYLWHVALLKLFAVMLGRGNAGNFTVILLAVAAYVGSGILTYLYYTVKSFVFGR